MMTDFPRLLVATEFPPNGAGGGAAVVRQMLKDWPVGKLFWWSCYPDSVQLFGRSVASHRVALIPKKLSPNRRWRTQKSWVLETFWVPWATRHLQTTLEIVKPEVIWSIPHCWAIPPMKRVLPRAGIRFHASMHDYMDDRSFGARLGLRRSQRIAAMADEIYQAAVTRDAICQPMVDDLRQRTGCDGLITRAGLEQEDFDYLTQPPKIQAGPIRIAYAGTIIAKDEFALVARAVGQIRNQLPRPVTLELYGDHSYRSQEWFDASWMNEHGNLAKAELSSALKECDWGFAPMRLTDDDPRYNRFSLPTKFVSYLATGLPTLMPGHPESTVMKMATQYNVGLRMTDGNFENLKRELLAVLSEPNPKMKYHSEIQRCALAEFDARRMRSVLWENFLKCASTSRR